MKKIKNIIFSFLLAVTTLSVFIGCHTIENDDVYQEEYQKVLSENKLSMNIVDVYYQQKIGTTPIYVDGYSGIPYMTVKDVADFATFFWGGDFECYSSDYSTIVMNRGTKMEIVHKTGEVIYDDYGTFVTGNTVITDGYLIGFIDKRYVKGNEVIFKLKDYNIPFKFVNGNLVLPASILATLFNPRSAIVYNGTALYVMPSSYITTNGTDVASKNFWKSKKEYISYELAELNYNGLCFFMDNFYGLKKEHDITSFDTFFKNNGLNYNLSSTDVASSGSALYELTTNLIDDLHTAYTLTSPFIGKGNNISGSNKSVSARKLIDDREYLLSVKNKKDAANAYVYPAAQYSFYVKGNTAFLNFNSFKIHESAENMKKNFSTAKLDAMNYSSYNKYITFGSMSQSTLSGFCTDCINNFNAGYGWKFTDSYTDDVYLLTIFANYCIKKINAAAVEANKIKNVVVDLSVNTGGVVDSCVFIAGWLCGGSYQTILNTVDNSVKTIQYFSDVNCDSKFDTEVGCNDNIADLNRIIITSPVSFSCGTMLPTMVDQNSRITLMGKRSGGGACLVNEAASADGNSFQISGVYKQGTLQNGAFITNDNGIDVDVNIPLENFETVYNRDNFSSTYVDYLR